VDATVELLGADASTVRTLRGGRLELAASSGIPNGVARRLPSLDPLDPGLGPIVNADLPWACEDILSAADAGPLAGHARHLALRGALVVALRHREAIVGLLIASTRAPRRWSSDDMEVLRQLCAHAAVAIHNVDLLERTQARAAQLAVVQAASARMNRANTVESVGRAIVEELRRILDYHNARVYVLEPPDDLVPIAFEGRVGAYEDVDFELLRTKLGQGFTGWAALHGEALLVADTTRDPRGMTIPGTPEVDESMLVVPMRYDEEIVGVITLSKLGLNQFTEDDLQLLSILADQAATALESARLLGRSETLAAELRRLLDMSAELTQSLDPREVALVIARHVALALGVDACAVSLWNQRDDRVETLGTWPPESTAAAEPWYELSRFPETRRVLETRATVTVDVDDPAADQAEVEVMRREGARMLGMFPLVAKGQSVGLVELTSARAVTWDAARLGLARTMANEAAVALENARLYDAARALADRDPLTGFFNHRYLYERLGAELLRAHRSRRPVSLLMLDLDDFKLVNDTFGHQLGDQCLVRIAEVVRQTLRASDVPARYGGDEFAIILPEADAEAAAAAARRIHAALRDHPFEVDGRGVVPVALSIGTASAPGDGRTATDLVAAADARMYEIKVATHAPGAIAD